MTKRSAKFFEAMNAYNEDREEEALGLMEECAEEGDPVACYTTALWYENGEGTMADSERRAHWMQRLEVLAEQDDLEAQWELSGKLRWGNLLPLNIERANYWLERAAEGGYGEAQHHLAWYYEYGQYDYPVDPAEAAKWYQCAFDQEHPETLYLYAVRLFRDGQPTEEAIKLLQKAADKGLKQAEHVLKSYTH
jgi:TPR repeat protein